MYVILYTEDYYVLLLYYSNLKSFSKHRTAITDAEVQYEHT